MTVPEKGIIIAIAFLALAASGTCRNPVTIGEVEEGTKIFFKLEVKANAEPHKFLQREANLAPQAKKIGAIVIRDNRNLGATTFVFSGGPNMNFANLGVTSAFNSPLDVTIEFYNTPTTRKNCLYINFGTYLRSKNGYRG